MLKSHPLRVELHNEVHTRPRPPISTPQLIAHAAVIHPQSQQSCPQILLDWCASQGLRPPALDDVHYSVSQGSLGLRWKATVNLTATRCTRPPVSRRRPSGRAPPTNCSRNCWTAIPAR
ncbi:MAG: DUF3422 family protein [Gammaproteobacteria bacterium]|nr:DUF3422 family protein [Gammaproteobacteria bacterium]